MSRTRRTSRKSLKPPELPPSRPSPPFDFAAEMYAYERKLRVYAKIRSRAATEYNLRRLYRFFKVFTKV